MSSDPPHADRQFGRNKDRTILLLDDDRNTLLVLHSLLEKTDARVIECAEEPCALRCSDELQQSVDLLVVDVILQDSNGPAVVRKLKPSQSRMRILYISGFGLDDLERRGVLSAGDMTRGLVEFLQKPFSSEQFLDTVQRLLVRTSASKPTM